MKTIDEIIFDGKYETLYAENSDGSGSSFGWEYSQVKAMMKEYALGVVDEISYHPSKYIATEGQVTMFWNSSVEELKKKIQNE